MDYKITKEDIEKIEKHEKEQIERIERIIDLVDKTKLKMKIGEKSRLKIVNDDFFSTSEDGYEQ